MKQIKTIKNRLDNEKDFDEEVNSAISEGWVLTKREVLIPKAQAPNQYTYMMLYAELEREVITEAEREEITEEERVCENCAHYYALITSPPCRDCSDSAPKWEPAT